MTEYRGLGFSSDSGLLAGRTPPTLLGLRGLTFHSFLCVCVCSLQVCLCTTCMTIIRRGQKSVLDPQELKSQMIVATVWVLGTNLGPYGETASALPAERFLQSQELKLSNVHILLNIFLPKQGKPFFLFLRNLMNLSTGNRTTTFEEKQSRGKDVRTC